MLRTQRVISFFFDIFFSLIFWRIEPDEVRSSFLLSSSTYCSAYAWQPSKFALVWNTIKVFPRCFSSSTDFELTSFFLLTFFLFYLLWIFVSFAFNFVQVLVEYLFCHIFLFIRFTMSSRKERGRKTYRTNETWRGWKEVSLYSIWSVSVSLPSTISISHWIEKNYFNNTPLIELNRSLCEKKKRQQKAEGKEENGILSMESIKSFNRI